MLKLNRERMSCDLKRIARYRNMVIFAELFGRQQILKSISASFIEKRGEWTMTGNGRLEALLLDKGARYKRKIVPLSDGYAHCIVWDDELFSEKFIIAKNEEDKLRAFQIWLSKIALPIPRKNNLLFVEALYDEVEHLLTWSHMQTENTRDEEIPYYYRYRNLEMTKNEPLAIANMDFFIQNEYEILAEAVESVFADFKLNKKVA